MKKLLEFKSGIGMDIGNKIKRQKSIEFVYTTNQNLANKIFK